MWRLTLGTVCCLALLLTTWADELKAGGAPVLSANKTAANATAGSSNSTGSSTSRDATTTGNGTGIICQTCLCDADAKVVNCSDKDLTHHFPNLDDWAALPFQPKELLFDRNNLVHLVPFPQLDALERLSLCHNRIAKIEDQAFWNLTNVVEIDLSHNHLTSEDMKPHIFRGHYAPENYEPLERLRVLRLGSNALHTLDPDLFEHLPHLEELYLDSNPFKVIDLHTAQAVSGQLDLRVLDLSHTGIRALPDHFLHTPHNLARLSLAGNMFTEPPQGLEESHVLQHLDLSENPFTAINPLPRMPNLTTLVISHCANLTYVNKSAFALLPSLTHLYLHSNPLLTSIHPYALVEPAQPPAESPVYPPLETLHLHDNALGYLESSLVGRWDMLKTLRLEGNPWVCDCENQWLIESLLPTIEQGNPKFGTTLTCKVPVEMSGKFLRELQQTHYHMRCLDRYGNRPERDAPILIGVLCGVLIAAPATLALVMLWRRCSKLPHTPGPLWSGIIRSRRRGNGEYSSAFYKPAETEPDFI